MRLKHTFILKFVCNKVFTKR